MAIAIERGKLIFRKTERELRRLATQQPDQSVHNFRTTTRRLQTLLQNLVPNHNRSHKKLLKALNRLRKAAGKVRDIDVQLSALRSLKAPLEPRRKTRFIQELLEVRAKQESRLYKLLKKQDFRELQKRLKRASKDVAFDICRDPLLVAREILTSVRPATPANEETLHHYRVAVKRARYAAEFAAPSAESKEFIAQLKRLQDALGNWHDWFTLTRSAGGHLGDVTQSSLVAALHNVTRAKFRQAVAAVSAVQKNASSKTAGDRKPGTRPAQALKSHEAAA